jgi:FMN-dependent NADH-azoreductase
VLSGKKLVLLSSSGEFAFQPGGLREHWEHLEPHVRTCAHYLGVAPGDLHHVAIEFQEFGDDRHELSVRQALQSVKRLARRLAAPARPAIT